MVIQSVETRFDGLWYIRTAQTNGNLGTDIFPHEPTRVCGRDDFVADTFDELPNWIVVTKSAHARHISCERVGSKVGDYQVVKKTFR